MSERGRFAVSKLVRWALLLVLAGGLPLLIAVVIQSITTEQSRLDRLADQTQVIGLIISVVGAVPIFGQWIRSSFFEAEGDPAEVLAGRVKATEGATRQALLGDVQAANVTFGAHPQQVGASGRRRTPTLERLLRITVRYRDEQSRMSGDLESIDQFWKHLPSRRLVILGGAGTGKTVLAIELLLRLLDPNSVARGSGTVIPVRISMAGWSVDQSLADWLTERIAIDYRIPPAAARRLIEGTDRRVLPILDGLDEMDPDPNATESATPRRALAALEKLNNYLDGARLADVVVTCRTARYEQLQSHGAGLRGATRIHVLPLDEQQICAYLNDRFAHRPGQQSAWSEFLSTRERSTIQVWQAVLATPWRLMLASTRSEAGHSPRELFAPIPGEERAATIARIQQRLLDGYVDAATRLAVERLHDDQDRSRPRHRYDATRVTVWLRQLAVHLSWQADQATLLKRPRPAFPVSTLSRTYCGRSLVSFVPGICIPCCRSSLQQWA